MSQLTPYRFDDLFLPLLKGTSKLTSYAIYQSLDYEGDLVPLWGGNSEHITENLFVSTNARNKENKPIRIFKGPCLIVSLDGSAGSMTYKDENCTFALNHHAGVLFLKDSNKLNLEYFKYRYENVLRSLAVSDGSKTLSKKLLEKQVFELPSLAEQISILSKYKKLDTVRVQLKKYTSTLEKLQTQKIDTLVDEEEPTKLIDIFNLNQGHQITDLELYSTEGEIPVYTSNNSLKGHWDKQIVEEDDLPCLSYPTKANSGTIYLQTDIFDANNTAVLIPREEWRDKVNLEWFKIKLPTIFLDLMTSKEGVSYLNRDIVENIKLSVPKMTVQDEDVSNFSKIESLKKQISPLIVKIDSLLSKQVLLQ